jgi:HAD superfamily hydrolase (TIGR01549 family)
MAGETGILLDVDGTLVDTTYLHAVCWSEALRGAGHVLPMSRVHHAIGMGSDELLDHLLGSDRDRSDDEEMICAHLALYRQFWGRLTALPGAADLVRECAKRGHKVVLASSASADELAALREALDADDAIAVATSSADAEGGKPHPDILTAALEQSGLDADASVFVGDAVWDGAAASKAGVPFVAVTCGGTSAEALRDAGAVEIWQDPADLLAAVDDSLVGQLRSAAQRR